MSIEATRAVWQHSQAVGSARLVILCIADHLNTDGIAWPSITTIADETKVSERQVTRAIATLVDDGELVIEEKGNGRGRSTIYSISLSMATGKDDNMATFEAKEKGDTVSEKGDISSKRVTFDTEKDDTMSPQSLREPSKEPSGSHKWAGGHTSTAAADFQDAIAEMSAMVATLCHMNPAHPKHESKITPVAMFLVKEGYSKEEIERGFRQDDSWWTLFGMGKKGNRPYPANIETDAIRAVEWVRAECALSNGKHTKSTEGMVVISPYGDGDYVIKDGKPQKVKKDGI